MPLSRHFSTWHKKGRLSRFTHSQILRHFVLSIIAEQFSRKNVCSTYDEAVRREMSSSGRVKAET